MWKNVKSVDLQVVVVVFVTSNGKCDPVKKKSKVQVVQSRGHITVYYSYSVF